MYVVIVDFEIHEEHVSSFRTKIIENARMSLAREVGCKVFDVCQSQETPTQFFLYELYDSPADFEAHLQAEHFKLFDAAVKNMVKDKVVRITQRIN